MYNVLCVLVLIPVSNQVPFDYSLWHFYGKDNSINIMKSPVLSDVTRLEIFFLFESFRPTGGRVIQAIPELGQWEPSLSIPLWFHLVQSGSPAHNNQSDIIIFHIIPSRLVEAGTSRERVRMYSLYCSIMVTVWAVRCVRFTWYWQSMWYQYWYFHPDGRSEVSSLPETCLTTGPSVARP